MLYVNGKSKENFMLLKYERQLSQEGYKYIAGVDEAGRGPLAGPVVVAAVVMPLDAIIDGVNDSKKLSEKKREELYQKIVDTALEISVAIIDRETIDTINILNATKLGMSQCIAKLEKADVALIDAVKIESKIKTISIIKGDALSYNIAAASIVAKVTRDNLMREFDVEFPEYGFAKHKGYGTREHIANLKKWGACEIHRRSFIKNFFDVESVLGIAEK